MAGVSEVLAELALVAGSVDADALSGEVVEELAGVDGESADEAGVSDLSESLGAGLSLAGVSLLAGSSGLGVSDLACSKASILAVRLATCDDSFLT